MFEAMYLGLKTKLNIMRDYPDLSRFAIKAYYEKDPEVVNEISGYIQKSAAFQAAGLEKWFDPNRYIDGLDLKMMYRDMFLASEGFIWEKLQQNELDVDVLEKEYVQLIEFWKKVYLKRESN